MRSYLLAMADLSLETARIEERQRRTKRESEELLERTRKGIAKLAQLKRALSELEREEESHRGPMQTWNEYMQIMISKDRQYTQQLVNYKVSLATLVGIFHPESLVRQDLDVLADLRTGNTRGNSKRVQPEPRQPLLSSTRLSTEDVHQVLAGVGPGKQSVVDSFQKLFQGTFCVSFHGQSTSRLIHLKSDSFARQSTSKSAESTLEHTVKSTVALLEDKFPISRTSTLKSWIRETVEGAWDHRRCYGFVQY
jgi:hypothetical protein